MPVSRASVEFSLLMLLGVVLFGAPFWILSRPRFPPHPWLDAVEERFAPQIERLREIALTDTRIVTAARVRQMEVDRELFAVPGILSAEAEFSENGWREYGPGLYPVGWRRAAMRPATDEPILHERFRKLGKGGGIAILEYAGVVVRPDGLDHEYRILFDLAVLRSRWEAEGDAGEQAFRTD